MVPGLIVAAPSSGSGKTVVTLGLLRHLARSGVAVASAKAGPDYIDPAFHGRAGGRACLNLDPWAMRAETLTTAVGDLSDGAEAIICEGVMGLFDGATVDRGSTTDLAAAGGWPVVLVIDVRAQAASAAAVLGGFAAHRPDVHVAGVIFNRVGSPRHAEVVRAAAERWVPAVTVLGCIPRAEDLQLPERHLGLVQAMEHPDLETFLDRAAALIAAHVDTDALLTLARPWQNPPSHSVDGTALPPLGQRIAIADDAAFAFRYPHVLEGWRRAGAETFPFSPLADEEPDPAADVVYLPGGYPELHGGRLAGNSRFLGGLRAAAEHGAVVFGECGGYMVLGRGLIDAAGERHAMAGLLPLETSFADRGLHLGYRQATLAADGPLGRRGQAFRGHEFYYATIVEEGTGAPLFACADALGRDVGPAGRVDGRIAASFVHLIDTSP